MNELLDFDIACDDPPLPCPLCDAAVVTTRFELLGVGPAHCDRCGVVLAG